MKKRTEHAGLRAGTLLASCLFLTLAVGWICADTLFGASLCGGLTGRGRDTVTVTVPDLTGRLYAAAFAGDAAGLYGTPAVTAQSGQSGESVLSGFSDLFDLSVTYVYSREPARQVLEQSPSPGSRRKVIPGRRRAALHLTVSMGQPVHPVPDAVGMTRVAAEKALRDCGLFPVIRAAEVSAGSGVTPGCILHTVPPAGTRLAEGASVTLYVAPDAPVPSARCPSLVGLDLPSARDALSRAGLSVGQITFSPSPDSLPGTVLSQSLAPDCLLPPGTPVALSVSVFPFVAGETRGDVGGFLKEAPKPPRTFLNLFWWQVDNLPRQEAGNF